MAISSARRRSAIGCDLLPAGCAAVRDSAAAPPDSKHHSRDSGLGDSVLHMSSRRRIAILLSAAAGLSPAVAVSAALGANATPTAASVIAAAKLVLEKQTGGHLA